MFCKTVKDFLLFYSSLKAEKLNKLKRKREEENRKRKREELFYGSWRVLSVEKSAKKVKEKLKREGRKTFCVCNNIKSVKNKRNEENYLRRQAMSASQERIPMLMRTTSNDITITPPPPYPSDENFHHQQHHKYYDSRSSSSSGGTNGLIINNYNINSKNGFVTRLCCHMMKGVQRNIQKCVAALVVISFFSIILLTQYMDSSSALVGWVLSASSSLVFDFQLDVAFVDTQCSIGVFSLALNWSLQYCTTSHILHSDAV